MRRPSAACQHEHERPRQPSGPQQAAAALAQPAYCCTRQSTTCGTWRHRGRSKSRPACTGTVWCTPGRPLRRPRAGLRRRRRARMHAGSGGSALAAVRRGALPNTSVTVCPGGAMLSHRPSSSFQSSSPDNGTGPPLRTRMVWVRACRVVRRPDAGVRRRQRGWRHRAKPSTRTAVDRQGRVVAGKERDDVGAAGDRGEHDVALDVLVHVVVGLGLERRAGRVDGSQGRQRSVLAWARRKRPAGAHSRPTQVSAVPTRRGPCPHTHLARCAPLRGPQGTWRWCRRR